MDSENENEAEVDLSDLQKTIDEKRSGLPKYEPIRAQPSPLPLQPKQRISGVERGYGEIDHRNSYWGELVRNRGLRYRDCRIETFKIANEKQSMVLEKLNKFREAMVDNANNGKGIILFGPKGTGKDHLMMGMAYAAIACRLKVDWVNGADMRGDVRDSTRNDELERDYASRLISRKILWISDPLPVSGALTDAQQDRLFRVIDGRYSNLRPTWVTVNASNRDELESRLGPQNADRLRDEALALFCDWPSHRETMKG
ncbi:MAG: ATP-binding protein [Pirellulaceae bacterium]|nr:ATP-binding protein [Pirellulaceae bacterium]